MPDNSNNNPTPDPNNTNNNQQQGNNVPAQAPFQSNGVIQMVKKEHEGIDWTRVGEQVIIGAGIIIVGVGSLMLISEIAKAIKGE